jgi:Na+-translocating ferredoxin:NAD+ oxidoreductase subunit B
MAVVIDQNQCTGCHECEIVCPQACLRVVAGKASADNQNCISCGICKQSCEAGAIKVLPGKDLGGGAY